MSDSTKFAKHLKEKKYIKSLNDLNALYKEKSWKRSNIGDVNVMIKLDDDTISEFYFSSNLDDYQNAYYDAFAEFCLNKDKTIAETNPREFENYLRDENHEEAFDFQKIAKKALDEFHKSVLSCVVRDESLVVCTCFGTSYREIEDSLRFGLSLDMTSELHRCGNACGSCQSSGIGGERDFYLNDIEINVAAKVENGFYQSLEFLDAHVKGLSSMDLLTGQSKVVEEGIVYTDLALSKKIHWIEAIFAKKVRPFLQQDGGDIELIDIDGYDVFVQYRGACGGCASSQGATLQFITQTLMDEFQDKKINVIVEQ